MITEQNERLRNALISTQEFLHNKGFGWHYIYKINSRVLNEMGLAKVPTIEVVADYFLKKESVQLALKEIGFETNIFGLVQAMKSKTRKRPFVVARQCFIYLERTLNETGYKNIGKLIGNRDHSTCIYSFEEWSKLMSIYPNYSQMTEDLKQLILNKDSGSVNWIDLEEMGIEVN
jgi:hypothetical protein